jgi:hypothetical protein
MVGAGMVGCLGDGTSLSDYGSARMVYGFLVLGHPNSSERCQDDWRKTDGHLRLREYVEDGWTLYVMGQIRYRTPGSKVFRFMGFCRQRMPDGHFRPVGDPDYEYED